MKLRRVAGVLLCLPFLGAASPEPTDSAAEKPKSEQVEHVPPEEAMPVLGRSVSGPDGKTIGRLVDVLVNSAGAPEAAVIDFGGFMGVGARKIAVHWRALHFAPSDPKQPVTLEMTFDDIKAAPEYKYVSKPAPVVVPVAAQPASPAGDATDTERPTQTAQPATPPSGQ